MLKKIYRLPSGSRLTSSRLIRLPAFTVRVQRNNLANSRFAFVVSKQVDNRATTRNRLKRRLRSLIEVKLAKIKQGYDFLFILRRSALDMDNDLLDQQLVQSLVGLQLV